MKDMPLTPSLEPKVDSGLRMPTLNRLTSTDWPLTNRIRESSNGKVNIVRTEDAGKSPTPKARSYSSHQFSKSSGFGRSARKYGTTSALSNCE